MYSYNNYIYHRTCYHGTKPRILRKHLTLIDSKTNNIIKYIYEFFSKGKYPFPIINLGFYKEFFSNAPQLNVVTYRLVVASDDQILISPSSYCALIKRMYNSHVRYLLKSQQTTFMKLHAVTAIRSNANHSPDNKCYLKQKTSPLLTGIKHLTELENKQKR